MKYDIPIYGGNERYRFKLIDEEHRKAWEKAFGMRIHGPVAVVTRRFYLKHEATIASIEILAALRSAPAREFPRR